VAAEGWNLDLRTYPLKNASAAELADLLLDVLSVNKFPLRIAVDRRSNQLIVNGPMVAHEKIGALLNRLDMPGDNEPRRDKK
jgi:type II secretory pathway component GspD/PulD (secretin)